MVTTSSRRQTMVWVMLILLTVVSAEVLGNRGFIVGNSIRVSTVILVTFVKGRLVGLDYMELRTAPWLLRLAFETWLVVISCLILFLYMRSEAHMSLQYQRGFQATTLVC